MIVESSAQINQEEKLTDVVIEAKTGGDEDGTVVTKEPKKANEE